MKFITSYTINTFLSFILCLAIGSSIYLFSLISTPEYASLTYSIGSIILYFLLITFAVAQIILQKIRSKKNGDSLFYNFVGTANIFSTIAYTLYFLILHTYQSGIIYQWILPFILGIIIHIDIMNRHKK
jgi:hypothetical protein